MIYDLAAGADQNALNAVAESFYGAFRNLFKVHIDIGSPVLTSIDVDFQAAPTLQLGASAEAQAQARSYLATLPDVDQDQGLKRLLDPMTVSCAQVSVAFAIPGYPVTVTGALKCTAGIGFGDNDELSLALGVATIDIPGDRALSDLFNQYGALLTNYLNQVVLGRINIPIPSFFGPVVPLVTNETSVGGNPFMVVYDGFPPVHLPSGPGNEWPAATVFIGIDATAINSVAAAEIPSPNGKGGCDDPNLSWDYLLKLTPDVTISPGAGDVIQVGIVANGSANFTWHTAGGLPNISFSAGISGSAMATGRIAITPTGENQAISLSILEAGNFDLSASIEGIPTGLIPGLGVVIDSLLDTLASLAAGKLEGRVFTLYSIAPIPVRFSSGDGQLCLRKLALTQVTGAAGIPLLMVTGHPVFQATG